MLSGLKQSAKLFLQQFVPVEIPVRWVRKDEDSWLARHLGGDSLQLKRGALSAQIESLAQETNRLGAQPLWEGYQENNLGGATREPDNVRTAPAIGNFYSHLVQQRRPQTIVEFGTAFGVSGMYFLAGLKANGAGRLLTFEPNEIWAGLAQKNLSRISDRFQLTVGTFEEHIDRVLPAGEKIDLAFIDAIHTKEFVLPQLELVLERCSAKALIILDDLEFSDSMRECWQEVSTDSRFSASAVLCRGVGIVELK